MTATEEFERFAGRWAMSEDEVREALYAAGWGGPRRIWRWEGSSGWTAWHVADAALTLVACGLLVGRRAPVEASAATPPFEDAFETDPDALAVAVVERWVGSRSSAFEPPAAVALRPARVCRACVHELKVMMAEEVRAELGDDMFRLATSHPEAFRTWLLGRGGGSARFRPV